MPAPEPFDAARQAYHHGDVGRAIDLCQQILDVDGGHTDTTYLLAVCHSRQGHFIEAEACFREVILRAPTNAGALANYANALWEMRRIDEAQTLCVRSLALDDTNPDALNLLGSILVVKRDLVGAETCFLQALGRRPHFPFALNNLGNLQYQLGKLAEAIASYRAALQLVPDYAEALTNLGTALKASMQLTEARVCFEKALALSPTDSRAKLKALDISEAWNRPLYGKSLELRRPCATDADFLFACRRNADFVVHYNQFTRLPRSAEAVREQLVKENASHPYEFKSIEWVVIAKGNPQPIGVAGLADIQFQHRRAELLVGFPSRLHRAAWRPLEATLLVMDFAFNRVRMNKLTSFVYRSNQYAQDNTIALGFNQESLLKQHIAIADQYIDLYGNGLTANEFRETARLAKLSSRVLGMDITQPPK